MNRLWWMVCISGLANAGPALAQSVNFQDSNDAWTGATANDTLVATFSELIWPTNTPLSGEWMLNGVTYSGHAGTPFPNIYVITTSPLTGPALTANGDEDIDLVPNPTRTALAFDLAVNHFGTVTVTVYDAADVQIDQAVVPANTNGFFGCTSSVPIGRVNFRSVNGAIQNSLLDNVRLADACVVISDQPAPVSTCASGTAMFSVAAATTGSLNYQWQFQDTGGWMNLTDGSAVPIGAAYTAHVQGSLTNQMTLGSLTRVGAVAAGGPNSSIPVHCVISNLCGSAASDPAAWTVCYANCDCSTATPILNTNDFQCFLNAFAAAAPYANCDESTAAPVLNANDFQCFLNAYAAGCP